MAFRLRQPQVLALLGELHRLPPNRPTALRGRLQHFQRLSFPTGVNVGRGKVATYGPLQVVQLLLAFEMLELGLSPERIAWLLADEPTIKHAVRLAATHISRSMYAEASSQSSVLHFDPSALLNDREGGFVEASGAEMMMIGKLDTVAASFGKALRRSYINVSRLLERAARVMQQQRVIGIAEFEDEILAWISD